MDNFKIIYSIDEIEDVRLGENIKYCTPDCLDKFFTIQWSHEAGYSIYGHVSGDHPTFVGSGWNVKSWKTFSGVIKAIKKFTVNHEWGFHKFFHNYLEK